jgi:3-hydroxy acid dehydrogenase/malonic semialdehyde reductase
MKKTVLITGATSGFGRACAELFVEKGWQAVITGRRKERLDELVRQLGSDQVCASCFDVRNWDEIDRAVDELPEQFSTIDVLVNNAGLALGLEAAHEAHIEDWETMVDTNIKGLIYMTRKLLPSMVARDHGHVINIGSIASDNAYPGGNTYGATKAFVAQFTNNLKSDLHGTQVRVTNIEPGLAETEFSKVRFKWNEDKADAVYTDTKPLSAEDIADAVVWAADRPAHVNIQKIEIMPVCQSFGPFVIARD